VHLINAKPDGLLPPLKLDSFGWMEVEQFFVGVRTEAYDAYLMVGYQ